MFFFSPCKYLKKKKIQNYKKKKKKEKNLNTNQQIHNKG